MQLILSRFVVIAIILAIISPTGFAQISGGEIKTKTEKDKEKEAKKDKREAKKREPFDPSKLTGSQAYLSGLLMKSYRNFEDQTFSGIYNYEENQTPKWTTGGTVGLLIPLDNGLSLDMGASYFGYAEQNVYEDPNSDSTFTFSTVYRQGSIPLKIRYTYGSDFQVFAFAGLAPSNIFELKNTTSFTRANGTEGETVVDKTETGYVPFHLMLNGGVGLNYFKNQFGLTAYFEHRRNMTNTYGNDVLKRVHKLYGYGVSFGLTYRF